jgi:exosortase
MEHFHGTGSSSEATARRGSCWSAAVVGASRERLLLGALLALSFGVAYWPVLRILTQQWASNDTYSFGVLVPFISGYLIWLRRERLRALPVEPSLWGLAIVAVAAAGLGVGRLVSVVAFQELSLLLMLVGLVALVLGFRLLRELAFPLAYLVLMLPILEVVTDTLHYPSQLLSATLAKHLLQAVSIPVHRTNEYLHLPNITLQVASVCSGVNFMIAVIAIGLPQAYLHLTGWMPKVAVIAFGILISLVSNGLRVATIGFLSYHKLSPSLHGPGHILQGLFVSSIGLAALLAAVHILATRYPSLPERPGARRAVQPRAVASQRRPLMGGSIAVLVLILSATVSPERLLSAAPSPIAPDLSPIALTWPRTPVPATARFIRGGPAEETPADVFIGPAGERLELFVGNLIRREPGGSLAYRSAAFPPNAVEAQATIPVGDLCVRVNQAAFDSTGDRLSVLYWYDVDGRVIERLTTAKMYSLLSLMGKPEYRARLVMVITRTTGLALNEPSLVARRFAGDVIAMMGRATLPAGQGH